MISRLFLFVLAFFLLDLAIGKALEAGLFRYYGLGTDAEISFVGHSHLMLGLDKEAFEESIGIPVAKYTREGVNVVDRALMIEQLLETNRHLHTVVYGVDAWMFTGDGLSANSYKLFYPFLDHSGPASYVKSEADLFDYWQHKLIKTSRYNEGLINSSVRGYLNNWSNLKLGMVDTVQLKKNVDSGNFRRIKSTAENKQIFEESLAKLKKHHIKVWLVYVPTISYYNNAEPDKIREELKYFAELAQNDLNITYVEFLNDWENHHEYFYDPIHLNPTGQSAFTASLIELFKYQHN